MAETAETAAVTSSAEYWGGFSLSVVWKLKLGSCIMRIWDQPWPETDAVRARLRVVDPVDPGVVPDS
jgi:hypothetical protein